MSAAQLSSASFPLVGTRSPVASTATPRPLSLLTASALSSFTTPAIFVPYPSGYGGQQQVLLGSVTDIPSLRATTTLGGHTASAGLPSRGSYDSSPSGGSSWPSWATPVVAAVGGFSLLVVIVGLFCLIRYGRHKRALRPMVASQFGSTHEFGSSSEKSHVGFAVMGDHPDRRRSRRLSKATPSADTRARASRSSKYHDPTPGAGTTVFPLPARHTNPESAGYIDFQALPEPSHFRPERQSRRSSPRRTEQYRTSVAGDRRSSGVRGRAFEGQHRGAVAQTQKQQTRETAEIDGLLENEEGSSPKEPYFSRVLIL